MLLFEVADENSWESLSENIRMALITALTVDEEMFAFSFQKGVRAVGRRWL